MQIGFDYLELLLNKKSLKLNDLAEKLKVTPQAVNGWKSTNEIPTKRVAQIGDLFSLSNKEVDLLLGRVPLEFEFRTNRGIDLSQNRVPERIRTRAETIFERFFQGYEQPKDYDLSLLRKNIVSSDQDYLKIANAIREEFTIPNYRPFGFTDLGAIVDRVKIKSFFLPFGAIGLAGSEESTQTAVLYNKNEHYVILIDSDRKIDEAHFDQMHELIHIFFHGIDWKIDETSIESLIDKVCGELIYPQAYILERFFNNEKSSKPITNKNNLTSKFWEDCRNHIYVVSPKGLARAMRDSNLTSENSELFKYLAHELHADFRNECLSYSQWGKMDFDFKDVNKLLNFYDHASSNVNKVKYPLFETIKCDVLQGKLSISDFADTFALKLEDAMLLHAIWVQSENNSVPS